MREKTCKNMQIHNGCKIVVLVGCYERFFQTKLFGGVSGNGRMLSLYERNRSLLYIFKWQVKIVPWQNDGLRSPNFEDAFFQSFP